MTIKLPVTSWGRDHVSTLLYVETRCVDHDGKPKLEHMRCNPKLHPGYSHIGSMSSHFPGTRSSNGEEIKGHDDWSIIDEFEVLGLLNNIGTGLHPVWQLTDEGWYVAGALRRGRAEHLTIEKQVNLLQKLATNYSIKETQ